MKENNCDYEITHNFSTERYDWQSVVDSIIDKDKINPKFCTSTAHTIALIYKYINQNDFPKEYVYAC